MIPAHRTVRPLAALLVAVSALGACDDSASSSAPPTAPNGQPVSADNPTTILGKSAKMARDTAKDATARQDEAVGLAEGISGGGSGETVTVAGLQWTVPEGWEKTTPAGSMRAAELRYAGAGGEARTVFFYFGPDQGGDINSNINRWSTQMLDNAGRPVVPSPKTRQVNGIKVTEVRMTGTYMEGMPGPNQNLVERPDFVFKGAIAESRVGNVFIRMTGPASVMGEAERAFDAMIGGVRPE